MEEVINGHKIRTIQDDDGWHFTTDDYTVVYGYGRTLSESVSNYRESFDEYRHFGSVKGITTTSLHRPTDKRSLDVDQNTQQLPRCTKCGVLVDATPSDNWEYYCSACFNLNIDAIIKDTERSKGLHVK